MFRFRSSKLKKMTRDGFLAVRSDLLSHELTAPLYSSAWEFFSLTPEEKLKYFGATKTIHGFYPSGREFQERYSSQADHKEFWMNTWPSVHEGEWPNSTVPDFQKNNYRVFEALEATAKKVFEALAAEAGFEQRYVQQMLTDTPSAIRVLHYPEVEGKREGFRSYPHEDMALLTLFPAATNSGLEVKDSKGRWNQVSARKDEVIVLPGQMFEILSNGRVAATTHRVAWTDDGSRRLSIAFFLQPNWTTILSPQVRKGEEVKFAPVSSNDILFANLKNIGMLGPADNSN